MRWKSSWVPGRATGGWGMRLLAVWLLATGLVPLVNIRFPATGVIMSVVAIAAGALILIER